ncbi:NADP-dependent isocitrate dehydrogenase [bacterium]|nr:NADP-dependent isocitrate dehydrogenase [bacterium]
MTHKTPITVAYGDGIGPEIMQACLHILDKAGAALEIECVEIGEKAYLRGHAAGIEPAAWDSIRCTKVFYKAPIMTPQGGGFKSLNVTLRKTLGLYANVRPANSYFPAIETKHPLMNIVIIRENEEDLYAGIEYRPTHESYQSFKMISQPGSERIIRFAFDYARKNNRKKVSCFTKDNIMKMTDGLFHKIFDEVATEYPDLKSEHMIIDIGTARVADKPQKFDVIVLENLYGDILSDVTAQLTGSVGLGISANIGEDVAMFEAIHGSAPDIAGRGIANPSGLLLAGVQMLVHIDQPEVAAKISNAWKRTIEEGIHTSDIYHEDRSTQKVSTMEFADAVIAHLGQMPEMLRPVRFAAQDHSPIVDPTETPREDKRLVGVDVYMQWEDSQRDPKVLGALVEQYAEGDLKFIMMTNRGLKVYPMEFPSPFYSDHWRCRYESETTITHQQVMALLHKFIAAGFDVVGTENLYLYDGKPGYTLGQGQ